MSKKKYFISAFLIFFVIQVFSQGDISDYETIAYRNEKSAGVSLNTNGWGFDYRYGTYIKAKNTRIFYFNFNVIKDEKEVKQSNLYFTASNKYVYGKLNNCFDLRFGYGFQNQIFTKKDEGSIEIRISAVAGPALAFLKPIYYKINSFDTAIIVEKFKSSHQPGLILGKDTFVKGLSETKINPGAFINFSVGFEHGRKSTQLRSLEVGATVAVYLQKMEILENSQSSHFSFSLYATYRIGKFYHGKHLSSLNEEEDMF